MTLFALKTVMSSIKMKPWIQNNKRWDLTHHFILARCRTLAEKLSKYQRINVRSNMVFWWGGWVGGGGREYDMYASVVQVILLLYKLYSCSTGYTLVVQVILLKYHISPGVQFLLLEYNIYSRWTIYTSGLQYMLLEYNI